MTLDVLVGIDRDGTIIEDSGKFPGSKEYPKEEFVLRPGVIDGLRELRAHADAFDEVRIRLAMITNQSGPARGKVKAEDIADINNYLNDVILRPQGAYFDDLQYCEHVPVSYARKKQEEGKQIDHNFVRDCPDYKPGIGMLEKSAHNLFGKKLDQCRVYMIGDRPVDVKAGLNAGGKGIFIPSDVKEHSDLEKVRKIQQTNGFCVKIEDNFYHTAKGIIKDIIDTKFDDPFCAK